MWGTYEVRIRYKDTRVGGRITERRTFDPADPSQLRSMLLSMLPKGADPREFRIIVWSVGRHSAEVARLDGG